MQRQRLTTVTYVILFVSLLVVLTACASTTTKTCGQNQCSCPSQNCAQQCFDHQTTYNGSICMNGEWIAPPTTPDAQ